MVYWGGVSIVSRMAVIRGTILRVGRGGGGGGACAGANQSARMSTRTGSVALNIIDAGMPNHFISEEVPEGPEGNWCQGRQTERYSQTHEIRRSKNYSKTQAQNKPGAGEEGVSLIPFTAV